MGRTRTRITLAEGLLLLESLCQMISYPLQPYKTEAILTPSFMDEKTEAQRNEVVDLRTHSEESGRRQTRAQAPNCWGTCLPADSLPVALQKQRNVIKSHTSLGPKLFVRTDRSRSYSRQEERGL